MSESVKKGERMRIMEGLMGKRREEKKKRNRGRRDSPGDANIGQRWRNLSLESLVRDGPWYDILMDEDFEDMKLF
jgi:hypothetical protein